MTASPAPAGSLEARLAEAAPRLTERVLAEMYEDPFWSERFGERGRRHAGRDGDYHVQYLIEALAADDEGVFVKYSTWLRAVLVSRGMCSRHLTETYERLAAAIDDEPWPDRSRAAVILRAGARALVHVGGDAGAIDGARADLAAAVAAAAGTPDRADDFDRHLSYLADALAFGRRELFVQYIAYVASSLARRRLPIQRLHAGLAALAGAIAARLPAATAPASYLDAAREALATP